MALRFGNKKQLRARIRALAEQGNTYSMEGDHSPAFGPWGREVVRTLRLVYGEDFMPDENNETPRLSHREGMALLEAANLEVDRLIDESATRRNVARTAVRRTIIGAGLALGIGTAGYLTPGPRPVDWTGNRKQAVYRNSPDPSSPANEAGRRIVENADDLTSGVLTLVEVRMPTLVDGSVAGWAETEGKVLVLRADGTWTTMGALADRGGFSRGGGGGN